MKMIYNVTSKMEVPLVMLMVLVYIVIQINSVEQISCPLVLRNESTSIYKNNEVIYQYKLEYYDGEFTKYMTTRKNDTSEIVEWLLHHPNETAYHTVLGTYDKYGFAIYSTLLYGGLMMLVLVFIAYIDKHITKIKND